MSHEQAGEDVQISHIHILRRRINASYLFSMFWSTEVEWNTPLMAKITHFHFASSVICISLEDDK